MSGWHEKPIHAGYTYLASPYSHPDPAVVQWRYEQAVLAAGRLMRRGAVVFSPIAHSHVIAAAVSLPTTWEYWREIDTVFVRAAARLTVLQLDGWLNSRGVQDEIGIAVRYGVPVDYLKPEDV